MNKNIEESFTFLINEYYRLKLKDKNKNITKEEIETLLKLSSFIGKKDKKNEE